MSIGKALQRARVHAGLSIGQVQALTRIRRDVLIDFEADQQPVDPNQLDTLAFLYGVTVQEIQRASTEAITFREAMTALHAGNADPFVLWVRIGETVRNVQ